MTYHVGETKQFAHAERDSGGGLLPLQPGQWSVSNPAVAEISPTGLAQWLAVGETEIVFAVQGYRKAGFFHAQVFAAPPAHLIATPASVAVYEGSVTTLSFTATDVDDDPITNFSIDSVTSDDESIATLIRLSETDVMVVGHASGDATITAVSGAVSLDVAVDVLPPLFLSETDADARYRRLGITIQDSEVTKTPTVPLGDVSGAVPLPWTYPSRAKSIRLVGNTVATLSALPVGEFAFVDVFQDTPGGRAFHLVIDPALPQQEWDLGEEPEQSSGANRRDSYMAYNEGARVVCSRTWKDIPTL